MQEFDAPELLYLAALFHDIAKGRGGDHSHAGRARRDALLPRARRCAKADAKLVAWLVEHHLVMSATAQKQDLSDPEVISDFATLVRDERSLTALYILTVADIRGTSPKVWNAWKGKLLEDLFRSTRRILRGDTEYAAKSIEAKKAEALRIFRQYVPDAGAPRGALEALRRRTTSSASRRARSAGTRARSACARRRDRPVVRARLSPIGEGLQVLVYAHDQPGRLRAHHRLLRAPPVRHRGGEDLHDPARLRAGRLPGPLARPRRRALPRPHPQGGGGPRRPRSRRRRRSAPRPRGGVSRWVKHFPFEPKVEIVRTRTGDAWQVFASCADRPGLLSAIARAMLARGLNLVDARVTTLGARAEDVFVVNGPALEDEAGREAFARGAAPGARRRP